jgi:hypothetical protein
LSNLRTKCVSVWEPERSEHVRVKLVLQICCTLHTEEEEEEEEMTPIYLIPKRASGELKGTRRLLPSLPPFGREHLERAQTSRCMLSVQSTLGQK